MNNPKQNPVPVDIRDSVYYAAVRNGGDREWEFLYQQYLETNSDSEKVRCMYALTKATRHDLLKRTLEMSFDPKIVRPQDTFRLIVGVSNNPHGTDVVYKYTKDHIAELSSTYGELGSNLLPRILGAVIDQVTDVAQIKDIEAFLEEHKGETKTASRQISQSLEAAYARVDWMEENIEEINTFLKDFLG